MERTIIHLNVADFAVAVEREVDCRLKNRPVIIAPEGAVRSRVYDMSQEAYVAGVRKGMSLRRATRLCGSAEILSPHCDRYERAMKSLLKRALPYSPLIEMDDCRGHLFIDATGTHQLFGPAMDVARRLRREIKRDLGFDPIWSVASNKLVAKVATRLVKPVGEYLVAAGEEEAVLAPLPVCLIPGIEHGDLLRLQEFNLTRVFEVVTLSLEQLQMIFGTCARFIYESVRGIDSSPVEPVGRKPPVVSVDFEFGDGTNQPSNLESALYSLVEQVGSQLRKRRSAARRLRILIDYSDGMRCGRQTMIRPATADDPTLFEWARSLFLRTWTRRVRVRHIRLIGDQLVFPPTQLELFAVDRKKTQKQVQLAAAMDCIRVRFGPQAIGVGRPPAI
ncbi:MAG: hypothetical protein JW786_09285 [Desulfobacterales bacterium]|nr:hypothetical protein [Desulfobacterales bacterium]